jgi:dipeptidyl aminopeptidase/acylaminoacyl peptidase
MAEDNRTVYVWSRKGRDKAAIYRFDPEKNEMKELVAEHPQVDLNSLITTKDGVVGVRYRADKAGSAWFDEAIARIQGMFDKSFPNNVNQLSWTRDKKKFLITSYSDVLPASFYLFDTETNKAEWLADARPWIKPETQSPMQPVRYKARDGLEIPAYLTIPKGSSGKKLPMVVEVHGGPWVAGYTWQWNPEVQFLANRGYAVLQPNFRGTLGFGRKHFTSSFFQWGLAMQDDITDGVKWAIEQGIADPDRICIYGGSYGGYATMMGVAKEPDLFKCGINYVGVTDLPLLMTASWSDTFNSEGAQTSLRTRLGDLDKDAQRLRDTSPVNLASRIKANIMMAYGGADIRVVPEHGTRMRSALERAGHKPEWIIVNDEGHGYRKLENQVMFYGAMEKFLDRNIGSK